MRAATRGGGGEIRARETVWLQSGGTQTQRGGDPERREGKKAAAAHFCPRSSVFSVNEGVFSLSSSVCQLTARRVWESRVLYYCRVMQRDGKD